MPRTPGSFTATSSAPTFSSAYEVTPILDFGLAKMGRRSAQDADSAEMTFSATERDGPWNGGVYVARASARRRRRSPRRHLGVGSGAVRNGDGNASARCGPTPHREVARVESIVSKCLETSPDLRNSTHPTFARASALEKPHHRDGCRLSRSVTPALRLQHRIILTNSSAQ